MSISVNNQDDLIKYFRDTQPVETSGMTDQQVFGYGQDMVFKTQGIQLPEYEPPKTITQEQPTQEVFDSLDINNVKNQDFSGGVISGLYNSVMNIVTSSASELFTDTGLMGISSDFFKYSHNNSTPGLSYQLMYGKPKYEIEDYEPGFAAEIGSFIVGMVSPMELALLASGAKLGTTAVTATTALGKKSGLNTVAKKTIPDSQKLVKQVIDAGIKDGTTFGAIASAHAGVASAASQKEQTGTVDGLKVMSDASDAFLESFFIGLPAGMAGRGMLGAKYAAKLSTAKQKGKSLTASQNVMYGLPGQASVESLAFSALPSFFKEVGLDSYKDYPMLGSDEWFGMLATDATIISSIFGLGKLSSKMKKVNPNNKDISASKLAEIVEDKFIQEQKESQAAIKRVRRNIDNDDIADEVIKEINLKDSNVFQSIEDLSKYKKNVKKLEKITAKYTDEQISNKQFSKEDARWMAKEGVSTMHDTRIILDSLEDNPVRMRDALESVTGEKLSDTDFNLLSDDVMATRNQILDTFDDINFNLTGIPKSVAHAQKMKQKGQQISLFPDDPAVQALDAKPVSPAKLKAVEEVSQKYSDILGQSKKKISALEKKQITRFIAQQAGIKNPSKFDINKAATTQADIKKFKGYIDKTPVESIVKFSSKASELRNIFRTEQLASSVLGKEASSKILKSMGVKDGDILKANKTQLAEFNYVLKESSSETPKNPTQYSKNPILENEPFFQDKIKKLNRLGIASDAIIPVWEVVQWLGEKTLSKKFLQRHSIESDHYARFTRQFEAVAKDMYGKLPKGGFTWDGVKGGKVKNMLYLLDVERYIDRINSNTIKPQERKFINNVFYKDFTIVDNDGTLIFNKKKYGRVIDAVKKDKKGAGLNNEAKIALMWDEYRDYNKKMYYTALKASFTDESKYKEFIKNHPVEWIDENIYITRSTTKQFRKLFREDNSGKMYKKLVEGPKNKLAKRLAQDKHKTKKPSKEQIAEFDEIARMEVEASLNDMFNFSKTKATSSALKTRHIKLPEFIEIDGKKIEVYETNYDNYVQPYAAGMSKFLANVEIFPDMVKFKDYSIKGRQTEAIIGKLKQKNQKWGQWLEDSVDKELGLNKGLYDPDSLIVPMANQLAGIYSKTALGFITSGIKNFVLGQNMNMSSFYMRDYFRGVVNSMSKDYRNDIRRSLDTTAGVSHITDIRTNKFWDSVFALGGMQPTENANRIIAIASAKYDASRLIKVLQSSNPSSKSLKNAMERLDKFYNLDSNQIKLLKKYGLNGVDNHTFKDSFERKNIQRELTNINNQINTYAHINTQGSAGALFMPKYWNNDLAKPMLLFKKMAYQASRNQVRNLDLAVKHGDYLKIGMMGLAPIASGYALAGTYHALLGQEVPEQNSNWYTYIKSLFVRGEALGLATDVLKLAEGEGAAFTVYPALYSWGDATITAITSPLPSIPYLEQLYPGKTKTFYQSIDDWSASTSSAYRAFRHNIEKRGKNKEFNRGMIKYRNLYYEFYDEVMPEKPGGKFDKRAHTKDPFYRDLKDVFYMGTDEEAAKQYAMTIYGVATDFYKNDVDKNGDRGRYKNPSDAIKEAVRQVKGKITKMNPNKASFTKKSKSGESIKWVKWLNKNPEKGKVYIKELGQLEKQYFAKVRRVEQLALKYLNDPDVIKLIKKLK